MSNQGPHGQIRALECPPGAEYDEETFLYFLAMARARTERSHSPLRLLLATLEPSPGRPVPMPPASATRLFEGLRVAVRETDVVGWYRQDRVAGAVLIARAGTPGTEAWDILERRVDEALRKRLPSNAARSLRVRVVQPEPRRFENG
jgi:hypothetical protein